MDAFKRWGLAWACAVLALPLAAEQAATSGALPPLQAVPSLDVPRYMGRWYEIAKFPNRFQKQCVADTTATYSQLADGTLQVVNECRTKTGEIERAVGVARQVGGMTSAKLKVRFAPQWLSMLPFVWGDYWVVDLDERYELVAVSEPKREYLWILTRTPVVDEGRYRALVGRLKAIDFDTQRLVETPQRDR